MAEVVVLELVTTAAASTDAVSKKQERMDSTENRAMVRKAGSKKDEELKGSFSWRHLMNYTYCRDGGAS